MNWCKNLRLKGKIKLYEPLRGHTTFRIGGPARYFIEPQDRDELKILLEAAKSHNIRIFILGAGSNILASDKGIEAIVIKLNSPSFRKLQFKDNALNAGAGCLLSEIVYQAKEQELGAVEFLAGIPATLGGAIAMNAGLGRENMGNIVSEVTVMDYNGNVKILNKKDLRFNYRDSNLSEYIILNASLCLCRKPKEDIEIAIQAYCRSRSERQDLSFPSAGCVFKNPTAQDPAGKLIDLCGLKGKRVGDACISGKHANFIVNLAEAKAEQVLALMELIKNNVRDKFNTDLETEIKIWQ